MSRLRTWLLTAPILVVGIFTGHELGYRVALPDPHSRAHALDQGGHGYFDYAPQFAAALAVLVLLAVVFRVRAAVTGRHGSTPSWAFAALPPLAFLLLETSERAYQGQLALASFAAPELLVGLALQLPFAIAALVVARLLAIVSEALAHAFRGPVPRTLRPLALRPLLVAVDLPRMRTSSLAYGERGPPSPVS